jgi:hypothetical protein
MSRLVRPHQLVAYSRCPRRCLYTWRDKPKVARETVIVSDVIKHSCLFASRKQRLIPWRHIPPLLDKIITEHMLDSTEGKMYEHLLTQLHRWYHTYYIKEPNFNSVVNLPIVLPLGQNVIYCDMLDIVRIEDSGTTLLDFRRILPKNFPSSSPVEVFDDLSIHIRSWGFWKASGVIPEHYTGVILAGTRVKMLSVSLGRVILERAERICRQILAGIKDEVYYPSRSEQCISCPHQNICSL